MHRVELKVQTYWLDSLALEPVPNAPCGVESLFKFLVALIPHPAPFLMHRVELKALRGKAKVKRP